MPDPIPFPKPATGPVPPPAPRAQKSVWGKIALILTIVALTLRLLLALLAHSAHHPPTLPTFPFHPGDVFPLTPGDANIAKWAQNPLADGFVVQQIESAGHPTQTPKVCALEPDYMADSQQPGGTLTLLSQNPTGDWQVRWSGGNTLPPFMARKENFDANCGTSAVVLMSDAQLHSLHDILAGISASAPPAR